MRRFTVVWTAVVCALLAGCSGAGTHSAIPAHPATLGMPHSVSPALIKPAPMAKTAILPASAMQSPRRAQSAIQGLNWTQLPGSAVQVVPVQDGSMWALSTQPAGPDKYIWHYAGGVWTNISGLASHLAVASGPVQTLYAINSGGGTYAYDNGSWTALGGGASALTVAADGSVYVLSNGAPGPDQPIWRNQNGTWTQMPGAGTVLAASQDASYFTLPGGRVSADGVYILNSAGSIYYENSDGSFVQFPGNASAIAPTSTGGAFVLGYPASSGGNGIYYYDLSDPKWSVQPGAAVNIAAGASTLYVVGPSGAIYSAPIASTSALPPSPGLYGAWGPYDIANAFQFPVQSGYNGNGITIAIVIDAMPATSDLTTYLSQFGITRTGSITSRPVDGGGSTDMDGEATLDTETIAGLAPGANVMVYNMPDLGEQHMLDAWNDIISDGKASVVSMSFGGCEFSGEDTLEGPILSQAASKGIAFVASSGDWGNECPGATGNPIVGASGPATNPNIIAVGGVETVEQKIVAGTSVWNDCPPSLSAPENCMGSGGVSGNTAAGFAGYALPSYQQGLSGEASTTHRNIPDISLPGDFASLYMSSQSGWLVAGGTSWSAPQAAAMTAEIYQYCNTTAIANPVTLYYTAFSRAQYADFIDVTGGNDQFMGSTPYYSAVPGYDDASGIGQPLGMQVAQTDCPNHALSIASRPAYSATAAIAAQGPRVLDRVPRVRGMSDLGERSPDALTRIAVVLANSPAAASSEQRVAEQLQSAGFTIVHRYADHLLIDARAPSSVVERYFNTRIHAIAQTRYAGRYANVSPIVLPAQIAPFVSGVVADNLVLARPFIALHRPNVSEDCCPYRWVLR